MSLSVAYDPANQALLPGGGDPDLLRRFRSVRRHSRLVRRLRVLLPVTGALAVILLSVVTKLALPGNMDLSVAWLSVTRNSIIMDNPHLTGFDEDKRHYSVQADRAIQSLANPDRLQLEEIQATVTVAGQGTATITADNGDFDNSASTLQLRGGIAIDTSEGYALRMQDADIDFSAGTMSSDNRVSVRYQDSETVGDRVRVTEGGQIFVLSGNVRTSIMPPKRDVPATTGSVE